MLDCEFEPQSGQVCETEPLILGGVMGLSSSLDRVLSLSSVVSFSPSLVCEFELWSG